MTIGETVKYGEDALKQAGIEEYKNDAWMLFEYVAGMDRMAYFLGKERLMPESQLAEYHFLIEERQKHIPVQYLTHCAYFMGHKFYVDENVLIPRQDTEILVSEVLKLVRPKDKILDLCTGSGCIILSILLAGTAAKGVGSDISKDALDVAARNARFLSVNNVAWVQSDLFEAIEGTFDIIVSNPPYIRTNFIDGLMDEVKLYEPHIALDGSDDGLRFYQRITEDALKYLSKGGYLCYETGCDQGEEVSAILSDGGFENIRVVKDLAGLDRVVIGRRRK